MKIVSHGDSYIGRRGNNEDSLGRTSPHDPEILSRKGRLFVVCDGMGGVQGGEIASRIAVETVMAKYFALSGTVEQALSGAVEAASAAIAARAAEDKRLEAMGSTIVALVVQADWIVVAHVGDSRAYLFRDGRLTRLTRDHLHILEDLGVSEAEAEHHPQKHVLSRALGYLEACEVETTVLAWRYSDRFLLCTDGLSDALNDAAIADALAKSSPQHSVDALIQEAMAQGARDNTTAIVLDVERADTPDLPTQRVAFELAGL